MGARLLRVNILAPITGESLGDLELRHHKLGRSIVKTALEARLDVVEGSRDTALSTSTKLIVGFRTDPKRGTIH